MTPALPACIRVLVRAPDAIDWLFDDGTTETTSDDISTPAGRRVELFSYLGGRASCIHGIGAISPRDFTGLPGRP